MTTVEWKQFISLHVVPIDTVTAKKVVVDISTMLLGMIHLVESKGWLPYCNSDTEAGLYPPGLLTIPEVSLSPAQHIHDSNCVDPMWGLTTILVNKICR